MFLNALASPSSESSLLSSKSAGSAGSLSAGLAGLSGLSGLRGLTELAESCVGSGDGSIDVVRNAGVVVKGWVVRRRRGVVRCPLCGKGTCGVCGGRGHRFGVNHSGRDMGEF